MDLLKNGLATGIDFSGERKLCVPCVEGKQVRQPFKPTKHRAKNRLDLLHTDLCGPMPVESWGGARYFLTIIDDYTRKVFVFFLKRKSEVREILEHFIIQVEVECERKVKVVRSDNGGEYCNQALDKFFKQHGIKHQLTISYTPEQNGVA
jgi:transposase InsO family protein